MGKIIDTNNVNYQALRKILGTGMYNGAYYYSLEIAKNIIPNVKTDRPWDTLGMRGVQSMDHAIVFIHHNLNWGKVYSWLDKYQDLIYVCSSKATLRWALSRHKKATYLPLSIDTEYVSQFKTEKTKDACYAGNKWKFKIPDLEKYVPDNVDFPPDDLPREELLKFVAPYKRCYAVGRTALEAKCLGCKIEVCDSRYLDPSYWELLDNRDAAKMLQEKLDKFDNKT